MKPTIGRIVHFLANGMMAPGNHYPAIITHVFSDTCVNLCVFPKGTPQDASDSGLKTSVVFDELMVTIYSWHWPERE